MRERIVVCALVVAACACSASDEGSPHRGSGSTLPGGSPTVGNSGSSGAAGTGGGTFGNASQAMPSRPVGDPSMTNPNNKCEVVHLTANPTTPDVLIVLDRSGSMDREGRWTP